MLLAKIKEKLFNRRNTVIVESLDGDVIVKGNISATGQIVGSSNITSYVVSNIKQISDEILSSLKAGDIVQKEDSSGKHLYVVSFKKDGTGICLTYTDASVVETQSYDYIDGHWVYNSEDKTQFSDLGHTDDEVKALAKEEVESATAGTIVDALGLDEGGNLVKGQASGGGGTKLYYHKIQFSKGSSNPEYVILSLNSSPATNLGSVKSLLKSCLLGTLFSGSLQPSVLTTFMRCDFDLIQTSYSIEAGNKLIHYQWNGTTLSQLDIHTDISFVSDTVTEV